MEGPVRVAGLGSYYVPVLSCVIGGFTVLNLIFTF